MSPRHLAPISVSGESGSVRRLRRGDKPAAWANRGSAHRAPKRIEPLSRPNRGSQSPLPGDAQRGQPRFTRQVALHRFRSELSDLGDHPGSSSESRQNLIATSQRRTKVARPVYREMTPLYSTATFRGEVSERAVATTPVRRESTFTGSRRYAARRQPRFAWKRVSRCHPLEAEIRARRQPSGTGNRASRFRDRTFQ